MAAPIRLSQQHSCSFDQLVSADEQGQWHLDSERLGALQVDEQLDLGWLLDREICRLGKSWPTTWRHAAMNVVERADVGHQLAHDERCPARGKDFRCLCDGTELVVATIHAGH